MKNQHEKTQHVYRTRSGRIFKKAKRYITQNLSLMFTIIHHMKGKFDILPKCGLYRYKKSNHRFLFGKGI